MERISVPNHRQIEVLLEEIETDLNAVRDLGGELVNERRHVRSGASQKDLITVGYLLHGVYTAWEGSFKRIATTFENQLDPSQWHTQVIQRMALNLPGIRPAVIDPDTTTYLHKLRSFRHFFRHNYVKPLSYMELELVLLAYDEAAPRMDRHLRDFLAYLQAIAKQSGGQAP